MIKKLKIVCISCLLKLKYLFKKNFSFKFLQLFRIGTRFSITGNSSIRIGKLLETRNNVEFKVFDKGHIIIGDNCFFNNNFSLACCNEINIGDNCSFGYNVVIVDHDHNINGSSPLFVSKKIFIGDNVWVGANVVILKGVSIGDNSVIAAGSIITKNVPANTVLIQKRELVEYRRGL